MDIKTETKSGVDFGKEGEQIAVDYLIDRGYQILERNFVCGKNEVDIIALDRQEIVFVEVKTRATHVFGEPEEAVNRKKQRLIIQVANAYITKNNIDLEARFDVVSIVINGDGLPHIHHITSAFSPLIF
ncbi:MAG: YraN family protein [Bacteroidales bacterium]|jgi:putative endonuclease|nr:YraN family protein [Bacteroidales bacterium]